MAFNGFTAILVLYLKEAFSWTSALSGWVFALVGLIAMIVQGGLIGPLVKQFGELKLTITGLGLLTIGCLLIPMANQENSIPIVFTGAALLATGTGLVTPCLRSLISRRIDISSQGTVLGGLQGLQSLGTFVGGITAGFVYDQLGQKKSFLWRCNNFSHSNSIVNRNTTRQKESTSDMNQ